MAFRELTCFTAVCDGCDNEFEHDYMSHWPSAAEAAEEAVEGGWYGDEKSLFCAICRYKPHAVVPESNCCARCGIDADDHEEVPA